MNSIEFYNAYNEIIYKLKKDFYLKPYKNYQTISILPIGDYCKNNCDYCVFKSKEKEILTLKRLWKFLIEIEPYTLSKINFLITGGDPLYHPNLKGIFKILEYFKKNFNKEIRIILYVSHIEEKTKIEKWLNEFKDLQLSFSYDLYQNQKSTLEFIEYFLKKYNQRVEFVLQFDNRISIENLIDFIQSYYKYGIGLRLTYGKNIPDKDYIQNLIKKLDKFNPVVISPTYDYLYFNINQPPIPMMRVKDKKYLSPLSTNCVLKFVIGISQNWYFAGTFKKFITKNLNDIIESNKQYFESIFNFIYSEKKCKQCELQYICFTCPFYKKYCNDGLKEWVKYLLKLAEEVINENKNEKFHI